jgi:RHS repeat-associated protein
VDPSDPSKNWERAVGTGGVRCYPGDDVGCGDSGRARDARLVYPKGVAISADRKMYIADGTSVRVVDQVTGIISTLIGRANAADDNSPSGAWKPVSCSGSFSVADTSLRWPADLAMNPLDDSLHLIDDNLVMKVTSDGRVNIVAGRPLHCPRPQEEDQYLNLAAQTTLVSPQGISFSTTGSLFIAESDSRRVNRVSRVDSDGKISVYAGKDSKCNCQEDDCNCHRGDKQDQALETVFASISSLAVGANGEVHVSDQANRQIRSVRTSIPELTEALQEFHVFSPETGEQFVFNRFGLHMETRSIASGGTTFKFSYSVTTSNGKLTGIADNEGNGLKIVRDYSGQVTAIENSLQQRFTLQMDRKQMLTAMKSPGQLQSGPKYSYFKSSELIRDKRYSGDYLSFSYDSSGRLRELVTPTGDALKFKCDLEMRGAVVNITRNEQEYLSLLVQPRLVKVRSGGDGEYRQDTISMKSDRSFVSSSKAGTKFHLKTLPYHVASSQQSFPMPASEQTDVGKDTVNNYEWKYSKNGKRLVVNGQNILGVELNRASNSEILTLERSQAMLNVSSNLDSLRISLLPSGLFSPVSLERNRLEKSATWRWGDMSLQHVSDRYRRVTEVKSSGKPILSYKYPSAGHYTVHPEKVIVPNGGAFVFQRDETDSLKSLMTPRGHIHGFATRNLLGYRVISYQPPWSRSKYQLQFDFAGRIVAVNRQPFDKVAYIYEAGGSSIKTVLAGPASIAYHYYPTSGLARQVDLVNDKIGFRMRLEYNYHIGLLKETKQTFEDDTKATKLDRVVLNFQYDGSARIAGVKVRIGKNQDQDNGQQYFHPFKYDSTSGQLEAFEDMKVIRESLRKSLIEDSGKRYSCTSDKDTFGRLSQVTLRLNGDVAYQMRLSYNENNKVAARTIVVNAGGSGKAKETISYNSNGHLEAVKRSGNGGSNWIYTHDISGNVVSVSDKNQVTTLGYDSGDRVIMLGDREFVTYDERGFAVRRGDQRYTYNGLGQMESAFEPGKFSVRFFYDPIGRLAAKRDHKGNAVQFVYANPMFNASVTHVHYPVAGRTYRLHYDESGHLVSMETPDDRFYVGVDQLGSPVAVFDQRSGNLVKEVARSPFGRVISDSNPTVDLPVGFAGGLVDQYTHLLHFENGRVYDPMLGQWMTPELNRLLLRMRTPWDVFAYRFMNNNPTTTTPVEKELMTGKLNVHTA